MSMEHVPIDQLIMQMDSAPTDRDATGSAHELVSRYLAKDLDPKLRVTVRSGNTDPVLGDRKRSRMLKAVGKAFADEPHSKTRDFKRLLLRISILDAAPDPWETFKKFEVAILPARRAGVDVDGLIKEFAAISSKGVAHMMRNYTLRLDLLEWYKDPDYSLEIRQLTDIISARRGQETSEPVATNDEVKQLKRMLMSKVTEVADDASLLLIQIYVHPNTPDIQRDFIRQIGVFEHDYGAVSRLENACARVHADEPDTPERSFKQALLAMSIRNGKMDPRDDFQEMAGLEEKAKRNGGKFVAVIQEIALISAPCMAKVMVEGSTNLMAFDTYYRKEVKI